MLSIFHFDQETAILTRDYIQHTVKTTNLGMIFTGLSLLRLSLFPKFQTAAVRMFPLLL